jgi:hypothetical protein
MRYRFQHEKEEKLRRLGVTYDEEQSELLGPNEESVDQMLQQLHFEKEGMEEHEDTWQGLQDDLYSNLRDDLRSQYDQARSLMKLNQQLRQRLIQQTKVARQILSQTLRQKEKLVQRLEISAKDF